MGDMLDTHRPRCGFKLEVVNVHRSFALILEKAGKQRSYNINNNRCGCRVVLVSLVLVNAMI